MYNIDLRDIGGYSWWQLMLKTSLQYGGMILKWLFTSKSLQIVLRWIHEAQIGPAMVEKKWMSTNDI